MTESGTGKSRTMDRTTRRLIWLTVTAIVLLLLFAGYRHALRRSLAARLQAIRDAGYPVTLAEVGEWYPAIDGPNACEAILAAAAKLITFDPRFYDAPIGGRIDMPAPAEDFTPEAMEAMEAIVQVKAAALLELHRAARIDQARVPPGFFDGDGFHVWQSIDFAVMNLSHEAMLYETRGDVDRAFDSTSAALRVSIAMQTDWNLGMHLVGGRRVRDSLTALERLLYRRPLAEPQLAELAQLLHAPKFPDALPKMMAVKRARGIDQYETVRRSPWTYRASRRRTPRESAQDTLRMVAYAWSGLLDLNELSYLDVMEQAIDAASLPLHEQLRQFAAIDAGMGSMPRSQVHAFAWLNFSRSQRPLNEQRALVRAAQLAVAIERYRVAHGSLPGRLDDLVPRFLEAVPLDPFDGRPMRYIVSPAGGKVYSIGTDATDDHGAWTNAAGKDHGPGPDIGFHIRTSELHP